MATKPKPDLSRRERQIMDIIYEAGEATAADVREHLPDPPSNSSVRKTLSILEDKGHLKHEVRGLRYVFMPTVSRNEAKRAALKHVMRTFFENSAEEVMAALMGMSSRDLTDDDYNRLAELIDRARQEGK